MSQNSKYVLAQKLGVDDRRTEFHFTNRTTVELAAEVNALEIRLSESEKQLNTARTHAGYYEGYAGMLKHLVATLMDKDAAVNALMESCSEYANLKMAYQQLQQKLTATENELEKVRSDLGQVSHLREQLKNAENDLYSTRVKLRALGKRTSGAKSRPKRKSK